MIVTKRLLIVLVNTDPRNVEELGAPFDCPAVAAAMDYDVDVLCTATTGKLMFNGVAEALTIKQGARFWACPANLELFDKSEADLIPECSGVMGAAAMIQDVMDGSCRVLNDLIATRNS